MSRDREQSLKSAELLLKQGKVQAALVELEKLAAAAPDDLLTLNRMGDILARQGRTDEAVGYYTQIAARFTQQGFYPKAIAIQKKILRVDSTNADALIQLGELYVQQKLPGEARHHLLAAAQSMLAHKDFAGARGVYERLVEIDPGDSRHRARLAECRAAEGDSEGAGRDLLSLGDALLRTGKPEDAEAAFRRAGELLPGQPDSALGIARCLFETGRDDEALTLLEERATGDDAEPVAMGELLVAYDSADRDADVAALLARPRAMGIPDDAFSRVFRARRARESADGLWSRLDPVLSDWEEKGHGSRIVEMLRSIAAIEAQGHVPALERLIALQQRSGDRSALAPTLEWLARARESAGLDATDIRERLKDLAPGSPAPEIAEPGAGTATPTPERAGGAVAARPAAVPATAPGSVPLEAEAPQVPLNRADEEFVAGRITQAEILEKYGLADQALTQVREVVAKFPGHEKAQERLVELSRAGDPVDLANALCGLALARRAAGNTADAREAAAEADATGALSADHRPVLTRLGLLGDAKAAAAPAPAPAPTAVAPSAGSAPGAREAIVVSFEDDDGGADAVVQPTSHAPATPTRPTGRARRRKPGSDMIAEIRGQLKSGALDRARHNVEALRRLGYGSDALDSLEQDIAAATPAAPPAATVAEPVPVAAEPAAPAVESAPLTPAPARSDDDAGGLFDDDDLSTITAALESELFADDTEATRPVPESQSEQSLEDVFAAFKAHVEQEVDSDDFRTHYDLGIAYKEMGLMDEAISQFETASRAPELFRESCAMLAMCHRERDEVEKAVTWYREALSNGSSDDQTAAGIRYELAEVLLLNGEREEALGLFRDVRSSDPEFRDVENRIAELEAASASS